MMNLTEVPEIVQWPETHYVFVEKAGPFMQNAGQAWQSAHQLAPALRQNNEITRYMSLYKRGPQIYRAGFAIASTPKDLPAGFKYEIFKGGKYSRFVLIGPYTDLPAASGRVFEMVAEKRITMRDDFCIENYVTDPSTTPAEKNVTEILIPSQSILD
jgi:effector-binding domain-containing protein